jgi:hypothetical protein
MERIGFWSRMGQWFKSVSGTNHGADAVAEDAHNGGVLQAPGIVPASPLAKWRGHRGANLERLEQEYVRVVSLVESVQSHLEQHGLRAERMAAALDRVADSLSQFPESSRTQLELLTRIGERMSAEATAAKSLEQSLSQLPRLADAQRETMVAIGRQLDASRESSERVAAVLDGFRHGLTQVADVTGAAGRALDKARLDASARDERLAAALQEQAKRLTVFAIAAISLAAVAALASVIAMFF